MSFYEDSDGLQESRKSNVRPIKFRSLNASELDQDQQQDQHQHQHQEQNYVKNINNFGWLNKQQIISKKNNLIIKQQQQDNHRQSVAAVLFDQVCFQVDASQQQSKQHSNPIGRILDQIIPNLGSSKFNDNNDKIQILKSIKLHVPQGCIFGLLGPSSCGKTTLLRCLVGLLKPSSGSIELFGNDITSKVGRKEVNEQDGPSFGYMPQDLGLYEDFTIRQLLTMFGQYTGMRSKLIEQRLTFMAKFLELPQVDRQISSLSGGQKRRVSFAIACIHMPPLIILDEPTVGVDPLLRQSIWRYLRELARDQGKTIIITTHYIEEAAQADHVALMRAGQILVQAPPKKIMQEHNCDTLEEAFLQICNNVAAKSKKVLKEEEKFESIEVADEKQKITADLDDQNSTSKQSIANNNASCKKTIQQIDNYELNEARENEQKMVNYHKLNGGKEITFKSKLRAKCTLLYALFYKNYRRNLNSIPLIAFQFMLPIIQMISFSLCVGGRPSHVGLGLVNHDSIDQLANFRNLTSLINTNANNSLELDEDYVTIGDDFQQLPQELLSKKYLNFIDSSVLDIKEYPNLELALRDVRQAKLWAAIEFGENFTTTLLNRFNPDNFYTFDRVANAQSVIKLYPDKSNKILDMICMRILVNSFRDFLANQFDHLKQLPIQVRQVIFDIKPNLISNSLDGYTESIAAGLLASLTYIMAAGLTTFIMVVERGNGILERTYTSGVNPVLYLLAHALFRSLVMMIQIGLVVYLTFYILRQPLVGSLTLAYFMLMTLNFTGISYGLLVSSLVQDQNGAALTIVSSLVLKITMSGILWPLEAIPIWLRTICICQPLTLPIQALKQITLKGATFEHRAVQLGFAVSIAWTCLFLFVAARRFKFYQH